MKFQTPLVRFWTPDLAKKPLGIFENMQDTVSCGYSKSRWFFFAA